LGIVGFAVLMLGALAIIKTVSANSLEIDFLVVFGLALLIAGCGVFGHAWASGWPEPEPKLGKNAKWSLVGTFAATVFIAFLALWADTTNNVIWTVVAAGALGGLVHEIAQSKGTAFLPSSPTKSTQAVSGTGTGTGTEGAPATGTAAPKGEDYLGGLVGIVLGGAAGLLTLAVTSSSQIPTQSTPQVLVAAFAAGVALKAISDSAASPPKSS